MELEHELCVQGCLLVVQVLVQGVDHLLQEQGQETGDLRDLSLRHLMEMEYWEECQWMEWAGL